MIKYNAFIEYSLGCLHWHNFLSLFLSRNVAEILLSLLESHCWKIWRDFAFLQFERTFCQSEFISLDRCLHFPLRNSQSTFMSNMKRAVGLLQDESVLELTFRRHFGVPRWPCVWIIGCHGRRENRVTICFYCLVTSRILSCVVLLFWLSTWHRLP